MYFVFVYWCILYLCIVSLLTLAMIQDQALVASRHYLVETKDKNLAEKAVDAVDPVEAVDAVDAVDPDLDTELPPELQDESLLDQTDGNDYEVCPMCG